MTRSSKIAYVFIGILSTFVVFGIGSCAGAEQAHQKAQATSADVAVAEASPSPTSSEWTVCGTKWGSTCPSGATAPATHGGSVHTVTAKPKTTHRATPKATATHLSDNGWTLVSLKTNPESYSGEWEGVLRLRNDTGAKATASVEISEISGEGVAGLLVGSAVDIAAGKTATITLVSRDKYVKGDYKVELQVTSF